MWFDAQGVLFEENNVIPDYSYTVIRETSGYDVCDKHLPRVPSPRSPGEDPQRDTSDNGVFRVMEEPVSHILRKGDEMVRFRSVAHVSFIGLYDGRHCTFQKNTCVCSPAKA